ELAAHLDMDEEEIVEGLVASNGYTAGSLDMSADTEDAGGAAGNRSRTLVDFLGEDDPGMEKVENLQSLAPLMGDLSERERSIVSMRFGLEMTQSEIGAELGVSQMQVSRLLSRILTKLRAGMTETDTVRA
ncbi:sigma-70 family RNA polymerase sigma factor, partial [Streptomyces sp. NPDC048361]|uniref:sigma-70 family RNA polymerase sigma factor n=1 Tax=Streptomyces sp. NPDC048361 TaxID=3154720 RepID=UPI003416AEA3